MLSQTQLKSSKFSQKISHSTSNQLHHLEQNQNSRFNSPQSMKSVKLCDLDSSFRKMSQVDLEDEEDYQFPPQKYIRHPLDNQLYVTQTFNFEDRRALLSAIERHSKNCKKSDIFLHVNRFRFIEERVLQIQSKKFRPFSDGLHPKQLWKFILSILQFHQSDLINLDDFILYQDGSLHLNFSANPQTPVLSALSLKLTASQCHYSKLAAHMLHLYTNKLLNSLQNSNSDNLYIQLIKEYLVGRLKKRTPATRTKF